VRIDAGDPPILRRRHIRARCLSSADEPEQHRRRRSAENSAFTARENGRHVVGFHARCHVTHSVHTRIHPDEQPFVESFVDPGRGNPCDKELPPSDHAVLPRGNRSDDPDQPLHTGV
jgi:hypothetical protein